MSWVTKLINFFAGDFRSPGGGLGGWVAKGMMASGNAERSVHAINKAFESALDNKTWLELGPGHGFATKEIIETKSPKMVHGIEISQDFRDILEKVFEKEIESGVFNVSGADAKTLNHVSDASVDYVFGMNVIYFLDPLDSYLAELKRVLVPGGLLVFGISDAVVGANPEVFVNTDWDLCVRKLVEAGFINASCSDVIDRENKMRRYRLITADAK